MLTHDALSIPDDFSLAIISLSLVEKEFFQWLEKDTEFSELMNKLSDLHHGSSTISGNDDDFGPDDFNEEAWRRV